MTSSALTRKTAFHRLITVAKDIVETTHPELGRAERRRLIMKTSKQLYSAWHKDRKAKRKPELVSNIVGPTLFHQILRERERERTRGSEPNREP